ncbi:hypothetical protein CC2G_002278 [Coprinopsis cinerea AmutBmut pab1-1]|nr:hypothetical protein CC2G_002278 [Coprinopsis cinerea AmutBmut pab1-1]
MPATSMGLGYEPGIGPVLQNTVLYPVKITQPDNWSQTLCLHVRQEDSSPKDRVRLQRQTLWPVAVDKQPGIRQRARSYLPEGPLSRLMMNATTWAMPQFRVPLIRCVTLHEAMPSSEQDAGDEMAIYARGPLPLRPCQAVAISEENEEATGTLGLRTFGMTDDDDVAVRLVSGRASISGTWVGVFFLISKVAAVKSLITSGGKPSHI